MVTPSTTSSITARDISLILDEVLDIQSRLHTLKEMGRFQGQREVKLAYTKLQETDMWLQKAIDEINQH